MKQYRASWECSVLKKKVCSIVIAENREHAFAKVLADTYMQLSLLQFFEDNNIDFGLDAADHLEWSVSEDVEGEKIEFVVWDESTDGISSNVAG